MVNTIALLRENGNNVPHFSDVLHLEITIRISYSYKQVKVLNLVYFGSPSTASYNDYSTISINLQICSIFFNWKVTPIFALKAKAKYQEEISRNKYEIALVHETIDGPTYFTTN